MTALHIVMRKEARKMPAQNLFGNVTLDALPTHIPGDDVSLAIEHIDGVVAYALHNGPQLLILAPKLVQRRPLLGGIAHKAQHHRP